MESVTITLGTGARIFETGQIMTDDAVLFLCRSVNNLNDQIVKLKEEEYGLSSDEKRYLRLNQRIDAVEWLGAHIEVQITKQNKRMHELEEYVEDL